MVKLLIKTAVKEAAVYEGMLYGMYNDAIDKLNNKVDELIKDACRRAKLNDRTTVTAKDV